MGYEEIINEFQQKKPLYEEFMLAMQKLLESMLINSGYKYQIYYRIKEAEKLKEKIIRKSKEGKVYEKMEDIEDLAGIRIIFYFESDKTRFIKEIKKEITGNLKTEERQKETGYIATHIIASFGDKRLDLSEYKKFKDLKCEIQLTTIMHHAWSEIEHHLFYKNKFNTRKKTPMSLHHITMKKILTEHIKKANEEFNRIYRKIKK
jgi:ppGpp synthetase/RelA/SpoT-type nucleotidyltranferase